jgi:hypothetical protein
MATRTVRLDGTGDYTSVTAACTGAAASDTISITQAGTYASEAPAPKAGQIIRNDSGSLVTLSDVAGRATYMFNVGGNGVQILGGAGKIRLSFGVGYAYLMNAQGRTGLVVEDIDLAPTADGSVTEVFRANATSLTVRRLTTSTTCTRLMLQEVLAGQCVSTYQDCDFGAMGTYTSTASAVKTIGASGTSSSVTFLNCRTQGKLVRTSNTGNSCYATGCSTSGAGPLLDIQSDMTAASAVLCCAPAGTLLLVFGGKTLGTAVVQGCYASQLVNRAGTITTYTGADNVYATTTGGTEGTNPCVAASFGIGDRRGMVPQPGSPLLRHIPVGASYGTEANDAMGQPRYSGGQLAVGPIQPRPVATAAWRRR